MISLSALPDEERALALLRQRWLRPDRHQQRGFEHLDLVLVDGSGVTSATGAFATVIDPGTQFRLVAAIPAATLPRQMMVTTTGSAESLNHTER